MGTEYGFGELGEQQTRLSVYEMSGVFSLYAEVPKDLGGLIKTELTEPDTTERLQITLADKVEPAALVDAAIKMIQAASYWMYAEDLRAKLPQLKEAAPDLFT